MSRGTPIKLSQAEHVKWCPILHTVGAYQVARDGRVRQTPGVYRPGPKPKNADGCMAVFHPKGYPSVSIIIAGKYRLVGVHWLLLKTFGPPQPTPRHRAMFVDGDYSNLALSNLKWMTPLEVAAHAIRLGKLHQRPTRMHGGVPHYYCKRCKKWKPTDQFYRFRVKQSDRPQTMSTCKSCQIVISRLRKRGTELPAEPLLDQVLAILAPRDIADLRFDRVWIGKHLRGLRKTSKLTRLALASAAGVGNSTLRRIELGQCLPRVRTLRKILALLKN